MVLFGIDITNGRAHLATIFSETKYRTLQRRTSQRLGAIPPVAVVDDNTLLYDTNYFLLLCVTLTHRQNAVGSHKKVMKP